VIAAELGGVELVKSLEQRRADDRDLHYLDGLDLYGPADATELPLPDGLHPDAETHRRIGERFAVVSAAGAALSLDTAG
jgi:lysophospholipase L1-like esterase